MIPNVDHMAIIMVFWKIHILYELTKASLTKLLSSNPTYHPEQFSEQKVIL